MKKMGGHLGKNKEVEKEIIEGIRYRNGEYRIAYRDGSKSLLRRVPAFKGAAIRRFEPLRFINGSVQSAIEDLEPTLNNEQRAIVAKYHLDENANYLGRIAELLENQILLANLENEKEKNRYYVGVIIGFVGIIIGTIMGILSLL
jgi:hypothetical protein